MRRTIGVTLAVLLASILLVAPALAIKVIEPWKTQKGRPAERVQPAAPPTEDQQPPTETEPPVEETEPEAPAADTPQGKLAEILRHAATASGLEPVGEIAAVSAEDLKPPEPAAKPDVTEDTEGTAATTEPDETPPAVPPPPVALPPFLGNEPLDDYAVVALAAGEFKHSTGQLIGAAIVEASKASDAWGLFSQNRGPEPIIGLGQAASFGHGLRVWKGRYAVLLVAEPPDPLRDKVRLPKLARDITAKLAGTGSPPTMVGWLPTGNLLPYTLVYFHANAPISSQSLALTDDTEGVAAEYQIGDSTHGGLIVRYPDTEAALAGWAAFVNARVSGDAASGTPGSRRLAPEGARWNGTRTKGTVCAFMVGAATRNQAEVFLAQALSRATD